VQSRDTEAVVPGLGINSLDCLSACFTVTAAALNGLDVGPVFLGILLPASRVGLARTGGGGSGLFTERAIVRLKTRRGAGTSGECGAAGLPQQQGQENRDRDRRDPKYPRLLKVEAGIGHAE
jgi:hypothetical protein